jgi:hypothetical protein
MHDKCVVNAMTWPASCSPKASERAGCEHLLDCFPLGTGSAVDCLTASLPCWYCSKARFGF